jgi:hypothetical protein
VRDGYETYYVTAEVGMTDVENGRDLRPAEVPDPLRDWAF